MAFEKEGIVRNRPDCRHAGSGAGPLAPLLAAFALSACGGGSVRGGDFVAAQSDAAACAGDACAAEVSFARLSEHSYLSGWQSPHQRAFADAGAVTSRRASAHLLDAAAAGRDAVDLLARIGVAGDQFTYMDVDGMQPAAVARMYSALAPNGFVSLSGAAGSVFVAADDSAGAGIGTGELAQGAWLLADTGIGIPDAAASGKVHFYYGLNEDLDGRHPDSEGCRHIEQACIGAPHRFKVELRDGRISVLAGKSSAFAFATYLLAWERMPEHADVAAVFDLARSCVQDIGEAGPDADTGLGRLDVGCMVRRLARLPSCAPGQMLASISSCRHLSYWQQMQGHYYVSQNASPHQQAFAAAGIAAAQADRSDRAWLLDGGSHGQVISDLMAQVGVGEAGYSYMEMAVPEQGPVAFAIEEIAGRYLSLPAAGFVNFSFDYPFAGAAYASHVGIRAADIESGAWILVAAGNDGEQDSLAGFTQATRDGTVEAMDTGKVHFYYGLDRALAGRHASSSGCLHIEEYCIGAPYEFVVQLRSGLFRIGGTSYASPFGFAAYLMAWQRMPERTDIAAVFDLALSCVQDLGEEGPDADTGRGRLDIGCLAYGATQMPECAPGLVLVSVTDCAPQDYLQDLQGMVSLSGRQGVLQRAFREAGFERRVADRSDRVFLVADGSIESAVVNGLGISATVNYARPDAQGGIGSTVYLNSVASVYAGLQSSDLIGLPQVRGAFTSDRSQWPAIASDEVADGAWMILPVGQGGSVDPFVPAGASTLPDGFMRESAVQAASGGKVHFIYGLNDDLDGRHPDSDGCRHIETHCLGAPYNYYLYDEGVGGILHSGTAAASAFAFAAYLLAWERLPPDAPIDDVFAISLACAHDLGAAGPDAETGRGRIDIGCMARRAHAAGNPPPAAPAVGKRDEELEAYMDDFASGLFADHIGRLSLPGRTHAGVGVGFGGDSFSATYRPAQDATAYESGIFDPQLVALTADFGLLTDGRHAGVYYRPAAALAAGVSLGQADSFFGASGSGEFSFHCATEMSLLLAAGLPAGPDGRLQASGWLKGSQAGCRSGALLDGLRGREAGIALKYSSASGGWQLSAQAWTARFLGGTVSLAGRRSGIDRGGILYGGRLQISRSF